MFLFSSINIRTVVYFLFPTHLNTTINPSRNFHALQIVCVVWAETSLCWLLCVCVCNFTCSHQSFSCHCRRFELQLQHAPFCCHPRNATYGWRGTFWNPFLAENAQTLIYYAIYFLYGNNWQHFGYFCHLMLWIFFLQTWFSFTFVPFWIQIFFFFFSSVDLWCLSRDVQHLLSPLV